MFPGLLPTFLILIISVILLHTLMRLIRYFVKFPIPYWMTGLIDNPLRRKIQPPKRVAQQQGIQPGMRILEIGPGSGTYTQNAAALLGSEGTIIALDILEETLLRCRKNLSGGEGLNIQYLVGDVHQLPFQSDSFHLIRMIAVINEIPGQSTMLREYQRVLSPSGVLACSEIFLDPDYPLAQPLIHRIQKSGFQFVERIGNIFHYTLRFINTTPGSHQPKKQNPDLTGLEN